MKDLYVNDGGFICLDGEDRSVCPIDSEREAIRRIFLAKEPMTVHYTVGENTYEVEAKKDDIIVFFYERDFEAPVVIAKSKAWANNLKQYNKLQQDIKEKWAAKSLSCKKDCEDCENCCKSA